LLSFSLTACGAGNKILYPWTQEYVSGQGNIRGDVDIDYFLEKDERFEIGADKDGWAVFKDPEAAFDALQEKYADGIALIQEEYNLAEFSMKSYQAYKEYGQLVTTGTEEEQAQARFVSRVLDIFENSYVPREEWVKSSAIAVYRDGKHNLNLKS